jgi:hypothetical protein
MKSKFIPFCVLVLVAMGLPAAAQSFIIESYPILERLQAQGHNLSDETLDWMQKWKGMDLEDRSLYIFPELSGSTSINLKVAQLDPSAENGSKARGSFVTRNSSANPNTEVAYFNMAALLGYDGIFRPAAPYILGPSATQAFKALLLSTPLKGKFRLENKARILRAIEKDGVLEGCMKAKKIKPYTALNALGEGRPNSSHPIIKALQASHPLPSAAESITLVKGYEGKTLTLAHEYSILMTLDAVFQQWDRYSGDNIVIFKDENNVAHFYATDNGGADLGSSTSWVVKNLSYFSRYDRGVVKELTKIHAFLENSAPSYLGYTDTEKFIWDLGLRTELPPAIYVERLKRNIGLFLKKVEENEAHYGPDAYF